MRKADAACWYPHGGNIGIEVSNLTNRKIDNLVTLGTPVRGDYKPNYSNVGSHLNAYSTKDGLQILGGGQLSASMLRGALVGGLSGAIAGWLRATGEFGPAQRSYAAAVNIDATAPADKTGTQAHSTLWSDPYAWSQVEAAR